METFNSIINASQLTLVDFFATWCGPCKTMHPVLEQLKAELGSGIRIIKIDVDKNAELSNAYTDAFPQRTSTVAAKWSHEAD